MKRRDALPGLLWAFDLDAVARRSLYLRDLEGTQSIWDVQVVIEAFRKSVTSTRGSRYRSERRFESAAS